MPPYGDLSDVIQSVSDLAVTVSSLSTGFSLSEIGELVALAEDFQKLAVDMPSVVSQFQGLNEAARSALYADISQNVTFPRSVTVQVWVQRALDFGVALSALFAAAPVPVATK